MKGSKLGSLAVGLCAVVVACGSDDSSGTGGAGGCDPVAGSNSCPAYTSCMETKCMDEYKQCFGDSFMSGTFGGPCKTYMECVSGCNCDAACQQGCTLDATCQDCMTNTLTACATSKCSTELQQCSGTGGGGTGGGGTGGTGSGSATCADLSACCSSLSGTDQSTCQQQYDAVKAGGDAACSAILQSYTAGGKC